MYSITVFELYDKQKKTPVEVAIKLSLEADEKIRASNYGHKMQL
jgi:hypothetical protein